jgi:adenylate cyclase class 2
MQNVEFKAELKDIELARSVCRSLGGRLVGTLLQKDTYYRVPGGTAGVHRLKKRETAGEETEWILYDRPDEGGAKLSTFHIYSEDEALERYGARSLPVWVVVSKARELWLLDQTRVHLDRVEGLGDFLELESLISARQKREAAEEAVTRLRGELSPALGEAICVGYSDLIAQAVGQ